jgi:hypothetical protein
VLLGKFNFWCSLEETLEVPLHDGCHHNEEMVKLVDLLAQLLLGDFLPAVSQSFRKNDIYKLDCKDVFFFSGKLP